MDEVDPVLWPANQMLIYNFRTSRGLQPHQNAQATTMAVTQSTHFISLLRKTLKAQFMSQCHHHCSKSDSRLGLSDLINPRQVGSSGATSARAHCRRSVSKRPHGMHHRRLIPPTQMCRNSFLEVDTPFQSGRPFHNLLHHSLGKLCMAFMDQSQAPALPSRRCI
jgi:hypothetical protein